jgi:GntR family carbon starvation induced transcriptional regulator
LPGLGTAGSSSTPARGIVVRVLDKTDLVEDAGESIKNRTDAWEDEIVRSLHRLTRTPRFVPGEDKRPNPDWEANHHQFHRALLANCDARILLDVCQDLRDKSDRYRHVASIAPQARTNYDEEHTRIAHAAINGEVDIATDLLVRHYQKTLTVVEEYFRDAELTPAMSRKRLEPAKE